MLCASCLLVCVFLLLSVAARDQERKSGLHATLDVDAALASHSSLTLLLYTYVALMFASHVVVLLVHATGRTARTNKDGNEYSAVFCVFAAARLQSFRFIAMLTPRYLLLSVLLLYCTDPLAAERAAWKERQRAKGGDSTNGEEVVEGETDAVARAKQLQQDNQESLKNSIRTAREATQLGAHTIQTLHKQSEQMERMDAALDDANDSLSRSERILRGMKSFTGAIANVFSKKPKPTERAYKPFQHTETYTLQQSSSSTAPSSSSAPGSSASVSNTKSTSWDNTTDPTASPPPTFSAEEQAIVDDFQRAQGVEDSHLDELGDVLSVLKLQATDINTELKKQHGTAVLKHTVCYLQLRCIMLLVTAALLIVCVFAAAVALHGASAVQVCWMALIRRLTPPAIDSRRIHIPCAI